MRVYHFSNRYYGLDNLRRQRLKIATITDLNDPFELLAVTSLDVSERHALRLTRDELAAKFGMLCFSSSWKNPVQWSHYAAGHRGICLGFDVPDVLLTAVAYRRKRLSLNKEALTTGGELGKAHMIELLTTKYSHWRYENERRCFLSLTQKDPQTELYFVPFSERLSLKEVIVGHTSTISRSELVDALGDLATNVSTLKARLAFGSFSVVRQRNEKLWE